jgi:hypothetical protein
MHSNRFRVVCLVLFAGFLVQCAKDYNPFENFSNANALVLPSASSKAISEGDTLIIFTTETLAVYTSVREKIDSFRVAATGNMYFGDTVVRPPFTKDNYLFQVSYADTGRVFINVTTYRSNRDSSSLATPVSSYVRSPLWQDSIHKILGSPCTLSTAPVGDDDVLYVWAFGKDTVVGITSNTYPDPYPLLRHIQVGKTDTGYLWVSDLHEQFRSPAVMFTYLFYQPSPPKIKCTNKGLQDDTVITGDTTLTFTFEVIDSSGQGLDSVNLSGTHPKTSDSVTFYATFVGMKQYSNQNPKVEIITATNKIGQTTIDTFYLCYVDTGLHGDLVLFRLVNPPAPTLTTRLDTLLYNVDVVNYSQNAVSVSTVVHGAGGKQSSLTPIYSFSDSVHKCTWLVPLALGSDTIQTEAAIPDRGYSAETTLVIQRSLLAPDTTPPEIVAITINGETYPLGQDPTTAFVVDSPSAIVAVYTIDNESGIASVTMTEVASVGSAVGIGPAIPMTSVTSENYEWVSSPVAFGAKLTMVLMITVKNKTLSATNTTTRYIKLTRRVGVIVPLQ